MATIREISSKVCEHYDLCELSLLDNPKDTTYFLKARQIICYLGILYADETDEQIGSFIGEPRQIVIFYHRSIKKQAEKNLCLSQEITEIINQVE